MTEAEENKSIAKAKRQGKVAVVFGAIVLGLSLAVTLIFVCAIWDVLEIRSGTKLLDAQATGQMGDFFGGVVGTLIALVAVLFFYGALRIQQAELLQSIQATRMTADGIKEQNKIHRAEKEFTVVLSLIESMAQISEGQWNQHATEGPTRVKNLLFDWRALPAESQIQNGSEFKPTREAEGASRFVQNCELVFHALTRKEESLDPIDFQVLIRKCHDLIPYQGLADIVRDIKLYHGSLVGARNLEHASERAIEGRDYTLDLMRRSAAVFSSWADLYLGKSAAKKLIPDLEDMDR